MWGAAGPGILVRRRREGIAVVGLFCSHEAEIARLVEERRELLATIRDLSSRLAAIASPTAHVTHERIEAARAARPPTAEELSSLPGMATVERLPPVMQAVLGMTGHYRPPAVVVDSRRTEFDRDRPSGQEAVPATTTTPI